MEFEKALEYINSFTKSGRRVTDLSRIKELLRKLGDPQKGLKFVHIAGTNGKGSVLEMLANAHINSGLRVGEFTSPYMETYCDRIRINGKNISRASVGEICETVKKAVSNNFYSQFEITFAIALIYFKKMKCDIIFLEAGIGGDLDATNIIEAPIASVITSISLDHTAVLGNTVEEIAQHKLGIVKRECPVILSCNNTGNVTAMAESRAAETGSRLVIPDEAKCRIVSADIFGTDIIYKNESYHLSMCGRHQVINALTAIETAKLIGIASYDDIRQALADTKVPLRIELVSREPVVIIDGGHNEAGIDSLAEVLRASGIENAVGIFGMVHGKAVRHGVEIMSKFFDVVFCADGYIGSSIPSCELAEKFRNRSAEVRTGNYIDILPEAVNTASKRSLPLIVSGSLYLASAVKRQIRQYI